MKPNHECGNEKLATEILATIATTAPVKVGDSEVRFTAEALLSAAQSLNAEASAPMRLEPDPYSVPVMKTGLARVEHGIEFDKLVIQVLESHEARLVTHDTETEYVFLQFPASSLPFTRPEHSDRLSVSVDLANFDTVSDLDKLKESISEDGTEVIDMGRYSIVPEPAIVLSGTAVAGFILWLLLKPLYTGYNNAVARVSEELLTKAMRYFANQALTILNRKTGRALDAFRSHRSPDVRPVFVERVLTHEAVDLVLLERVEEGDDATELDLQEILALLTELGKVILDADQIKIARNNEGEWQFWYLHTKDGHVIASDRAMKYTSDLWEIMQARRKETYAASGDE